MKFSSALKIESPQNIDKQGAQFFPDKDKVQDAERALMEDKVVQEIEMVHDSPKVEDEIVQDKDEDNQVAREERNIQETGQLSSLIKAVNEATPTLTPEPAISNSDKRATPTEVSTTGSALEPKTVSSNEISRKETNFKSKSFTSETTKRLLIRKLAGRDQGRVQFSLKGGSSDAKLSKPTQSLHLEKTRRLDPVKKESSSQSLDTDASPPIVQEQVWWEMFILFWFTCGKKARMLIVALCALFAVVFSRVVPKSARFSAGHNRDNSIGAYSVSSPSPSLPSGATK